MTIAASATSIVQCVACGRRSRASVLVMDVAGHKTLSEYGGHKGHQGHASHKQK